MDNPTIIEESSDRSAARVKWWRIHTVAMTVAELSRLTAYSVEAIYRFERGYNSKGDLFKPAAWRRYLAACQRVAAHKGKPGP
jgi:hypothetical protein